MSELKISPNLFLEKEELDRLKLFLDDQGFRATVLDNSVSFGFIRKPGTAFTNALVQEDVSRTCKINAGAAIDLNGDVVMIPATSQLAIPADSNWYWIKAAYISSPREPGTYSIDSLGNLVCTTADGNLLDILRGQPNFPSRVRFLNAASNILEYDVEDVLDNNHAVLTGMFTTETGLFLSVVGTFTAGYVPTTAEKDIFQYDSSLISLVQSNTSAEPAHSVGLEFFLARVKNDGATLFIEDKRNDVWTTTANFNLQHLMVTGNPLIGVEQVTFDDQFTPRDKNLVTFSWTFKGLTYTVNLKLNQITISAGFGGLFKATNFAAAFTNGDFDGWRCYTKDGLHYRVQTSTSVAGTIQLNFDRLEATSFFSDVASTVPIVQVLAITPDAEEIEIICTPDPDISVPTNTNGIVGRRVTFPINELTGTIPLTVYDATTAEYTLTYRYKHVDSYGPELTFPSDVTGYLNEGQFNVHGYPTGVTRTPYSAGIITLQLNPKSYSNFQAKIDLGDAFGVDTVVLSNSTPVVHVVVGTSRQTQYYSGSPLVLSADMYIALEKFMDFPATLVPNKNGNKFFLQFKQNIVLNGHNLYVVTDYINAGSNTKLKTFTDQDAVFTQVSEQGLFITAEFDGVNWLLSNVNEANVNFKQSELIGAVAVTDNTGATKYVLATFAPLPIASNNMTVLINVEHTPSASQGITLTYAVYKNGASIFTQQVQYDNPGGSFKRMDMVMKTISGFTKADVVDVRVSGQAAGSGVTTTVQGEVTMFCNDGDIN